MRVQPYLKNTQILWCPSRTPHISVSPGAAGNELYEADYSPNYHIQHASPYLNSLGVIEKPAQLLLLADNFSGTDYTYTGWFATSSHQHNDGSNVSFVDGHTKWFAKASAWVTPPGETP